MADLDAIRRGLAANLATLRTAGTVGQVSAYLLENPTPPSLQVAGVDTIDYDEHGFGSAGEDNWRILIEAALGKVSDTGSQDLLNTLLSESSVKTAIEADTKLTSRLSANGQTVTTGQSAAALWVKCRRYRGQSRVVFPNGAELLLATWEVEVAA